MKLSKLSPQSIELEEAILGALLIEKDVIHQVAPRLRPDDFYLEKNRYIYEAMLEMYNEKMPIDMLTVTQQLKKNKMLELAGKAIYIMKLTSYVNSAANIDAHIKIIQELSIKRLLIRYASQIDTEAHDEGTDALELLAECQKILIGIETRTYQENFVKADTLFKETVLVLEEKVKNQIAGVTGIASGFSALDRLTAGFHKGEVTIIAARPAMGKSAMVSSLLANICVDQKKCAGLFSLEMDRVSIYTRMISSRARILSENLRRGLLTEADFKDIYTKCNDLSESNLYMDDFPTMNVTEFKSKARKMVYDLGVEIIFVDYIQLMEGTNKSNVRAEEVSQISRTIKATAKELQIPIVPLAQISRASTQRGDKRPQLSELRESGSLEQDADNVYFIHRPEYYGEKTDSLGNSTAGVAELIVAKQRNGSMGIVELKFNGEYTEFANASNFNIDLKGIDASLSNPELKTPF